MISKKFFISLFFALSYCPQLYAQQEVETLARQYFATLQSDGVVAVAKFMHPDALKDFKSMMLPVFNAEADSGSRQLLDLTFGPETNVGNLETMDPVKFMNGFMNLVVAQKAEATVSFDKLEILGTVPEGDQVHLLARITVGAGDIAVTQFEVLSYRPYESGWRLQLNGKIQGLAAALRANL